MGATNRNANKRPVWSRRAPLIASVAAAMAVSAQAQDPVRFGEPTAQGISDFLQQVVERHGEQKGERASIYLNVITAQAMEAPRVQRIMSEKGQEKGMEAASQEAEKLLEQLQGKTFKQLEDHARPLFEAHRERVIGDLDEEIEEREHNKQRMEKKEALRESIELEWTDIAVGKTKKVGGIEQISLIVDIENRSELEISAVSIALELSHPENPDVEHNTQITMTDNTLKPYQSRELSHSINYMSDMAQAIYHADDDQLSFDALVRTIHTADGERIEVDVHWPSEQQRGLENLRKTRDLYEKL